MEGLIPLVYKTIKKSVSHRHYKCLSTTGGADFFLTDFNDDSHHLSLGKYYPNSSLPEPRDSDVYNNGVRRSNSVGSRIRHAEERPHGFGGNMGREYLDQDPTRNRQMVRFRSHRSMFSCITG